MNSWGERSLKVLATLHPDLQKVANAVLIIHDCALIYGYRSQQEQDALFNAGKSKKRWPESKHNTNPSEAMDLVPWVDNGADLWEDRRILHFSGIVLGVADELYKRGEITHTVRWGGNWSTKRETHFANFFDAAHFELIT